jgi:hypothetical protein
MWLCVLCTSLWRLFDASSARRCSAMMETEEIEVARRDTLTFRSTVENLGELDDEGSQHLNSNLQFHKDEIASVPDGDKVRPPWGCC